jgi:hypothetical protein
VQGRLRELGYYDVGQVDGEPSPQGRTDGMILACRNARGLPLTSAIDDQLIGAKGWAGKIFGSSTGLGGAGVLAWLTDRTTQVSAARDAVGVLGLTPGAIQAIAIGVAALVVVASVGVPVWFVADQLERRRLADYRAGKHACAGSSQSSCAWPASPASASRPLLLARCSPAAWPSSRAALRSPAARISTTPALARRMPCARRHRLL